MIQFDADFAAPDLADLKSQLAGVYGQYGDSVELINDFAMIVHDCHSVVVGGVISSVFVFQHENRLKAMLLPFGMTCGARRR